VCARMPLGVKQLRKTAPFASCLKINDTEEGETEGKGNRSDACLR
jgi:hypothetical protein